jgi:hypothetical protein
VGPPARAALGVGGLLGGGLKSTHVYAAGVC